MAMGNAHERDNQPSGDGLRPPRRRNSDTSVPSRPSSVVGFREEVKGRPMSEYIPPQGPRLSVVLPDGAGNMSRVVENVVPDSYANTVIRGAMQGFAPQKITRGAGTRGSVVIEIPDEIGLQTEAVPMTFLRPKGMHQTAYSIGSSSQVSESGDGSIPRARKPLETGLTHHPYPLRRFPLRAVLNLLFPTFLAAFYGYILFAHIRAAPVNNIVPANNAGRTTNPRTTFYTWFIVCVFALDAAKSGIAGLEAGAMMKQFTSPASAMQTLWHADRSWGNTSGWLRSVMILSYPILGLFSKRFRKPHSSRVPPLLWWYLASNSAILFLAIPLSGIAIELNTVKKYSMDKANVAGASNYTFESVTSVLTSDIVHSNWVKGTISTRDGVAKLYFPRNRSKNDPETPPILDDLLAGLGPVGPQVSVFAAPYSEDDVWGQAWGVKADIKCDQVKFSELNYLKRDMFDKDIDMRMAVSKEPAVGTQQGHGSQWKGPNQETAESSFEYNFDQRVIWNVSSVYEQNKVDEYNIDFKGSIPQRTLEIGIWQNVSTSLDADKLNLTALINGSNPIMTAILSPEWRITQFGISCKVSSALGTAALSPGPRSFDFFKRDGIHRNTSIPYQDRLNSTESVAYEVFFTEHRAKSIAASVNYIPREIPINGTNRLVYPVLQPEHVQESMYKLLAQVAIDSMGKRNYDKDGSLQQQTLKKLDPTATAVVRGRPLSARLKFLNAEFAFGLIMLWAWATIIPGIWFGFSPRWASTLNGFEMYKFGIESVGAPDAQRFTGEDFWECDELANIEAQWWRKKQ